MHRNKSTLSAQDFRLALPVQPISGTPHVQFKSVALALVVTPATQAAAHSVSAPEDLVGTAVAA